MLEELEIPRSTYYKWRKAFEEHGLGGLIKMKPSARRIWNRLTAWETEKVLEIARLHPELSPRLLAVKITDEESFSISESTVYRILRENNLISVPVRFPRCQHRDSGGIRQPVLMNSGSVMGPTSLSWDGDTTSLSPLKTITPGRSSPMTYGLMRRPSRCQTSWSWG